MALRAQVPNIDVPVDSKSAGGRQSDAAILLGLERRESWAAEALFSQLEGTVERSLYRVLQQRSSDFEDLVQVTFERILRTLIERRFSAQCSLLTWASAIATNVAIDDLRSKIRERRLFGGLSPELVDGQTALQINGTERLETRSDVMRIQRVLAQMNRGQAEALFLHEVMGHDLTEIAEIAGISVAAAQSRLVRGRKDFRSRTKRFNSEGPSS